MDDYEKWLEAITVPEKWLNGNKYRTGYRQACIEIAAAYRAFKAKAEEPLAVLADRKGCKNITLHPKGKLMLGEWAIEVLGGTPPYVLFYFPTYSAAEKAAREWLNKLEDVK